LLCVVVRRKKGGGMDVCTYDRYGGRVKNLDAWLEQTAWDRVFWSNVKTKAAELKSDGCTGVTDWLVYTCEEHDNHYKLHVMLDGSTIDKATADYIFRVRIQQGSPLAGMGLGWLSPIAWIRWLGVRYLPAAQRAWDDGG
jgi:hypothetical protein